MSATLRKNRRQRIELVPQSCIDYKK